MRRRDWVLQRRGGAQMWGGYPRKIAVPAGARGAEDHPLGQGLLAARETPRLSRLRAPPEPRVRVPEASD